MHAPPPVGAQRASRSGSANIRPRLRRHDELALWPLVHLRRLLRDEAKRLYRDAPSPQSLGRLDRSASSLAEAERALAVARRRSAHEHAVSC